MQRYSSEGLALSSFLDGSNYSYVESLYENYKNNPLSVGDEWRSLFLLLDKNSENLDRLGENSQRFLKDEKVIGDVVPRGEKDNFISSNHDQSVKDFYRVMMMIEAYRSRGHFNARLDPLGLASPSVDLQDLSPSYYGFTEVDYERRIFMDGVLGLEYSTIPEIMEMLSRLYCSTIGVEFMHIPNFEERDWIQNAIEKGDVLNDLSADQRKGILAKLIEAEGFENFIDVKYKGAKRFGVDGSEVIIPALEEIIKEGVLQGVVEVVIGMPHRGRLNVLSQVAGKPQRAILYEFRGEDSDSSDVGNSGDVKYHLGASCTCQISGKEINISLMNNPSHLEFVDSVAMGGARARQDIIAGISGGEYSVPLQDRSKVLPILIHGDAAFAGQGIVSEIFGLSGLSGYTVAGNIHLIVNNQIGFTTDISSGRAFPYPSDISKALSVPVFHVNGDDPDAVIRVVRIATLFRMKFRKSVVIDVLGYRRLGHNEGDEPSFTQPKMYKTIRSHQSVVQLYADRLIREKIISAQEVQSLKADWRLYLEGEFKASNSYRPSDKNDSFRSTPSTVKCKEKKGSHKTSVPQDLLKEIGSKLCYVPKSFNLHKIVGRLIENRKKMIEEGVKLDWAMAEALAFGSLCVEGYKVRLSGQDCQRGTFSQRHAVLCDQETEERYMPLAHLSSDQGCCEIVNSMLAEQSVLGFEYGYSLENPDSLTLWEAQFGDFANCAQVIFDQFISSGEQKWSRNSSIVCLLPHGYEGQGSEHSSARLERFLQMCAENNMRVANCTSPANYFHILRRQVCDDTLNRKPLVLMTPKSLLRHKRAVSSLSEMTCGSSFYPVLCDDADDSSKGSIKLVKDQKIRRVILCTGKVYYDLLERRDAQNISDVYLLRIEQLYPFPEDSVAEVLSRFINAEMIWCQEEPKNMGAWSFVEPYLEEVLSRIGVTHKLFRYVGRSAAASPAVGSIFKHKAQFQAFIEKAFCKE